MNKEQVTNGGIIIMVGVLVGIIGLVYSSELFSIHKWALGAVLISGGYIMYKGIKQIIQGLRVKDNRVEEV